ncbi:hypothetical protein GCM10023185_26410 [Hymenobacter saemangeumensis]|uniref:Uncharacterized protein n=1 Tax=Hymenobacter saemangeumensis TaxID=1084522 RepID=A0ABP8IIP5_9BACT
MPGLVGKLQVVGSPGMAQPYPVEAVVGSESRQLLQAQPFAVKPEEGRQIIGWARNAKRRKPHQP